MFSTPTNNVTLTDEPLLEKNDLSNLIGFLDLLIQIDLERNHTNSEQTKTILNNIIKRDSNE